MLLARTYSGYRGQVWHVYRRTNRRGCYYTTSSQPKVVVAGEETRVACVTTRRNAAQHESRIESMLVWCGSDR